MNLTQELEAYIAQMAPHHKERQAGKLLIRALDALRTTSRALEQMVDEHCGGRPLESGRVLNSWGLDTNGEGAGGGEVNTDIILPSDERAARQVTITGWASRNGRFYGDDERLARWDGSTHVPCDACGLPTPKSYTKCQDCRDLLDAEKFDAMCELPWDGKSMVFSDSRDEYFSSPAEAHDSLEDGETMDDLRLLLCKPQYASISQDHFSDIIPTEGDGDVPDELEAAIEAFNKSVANVVVSWAPIDVRLQLNGDNLTSNGGKK